MSEFIKEKTNIIIASSNLGKISELQALLPDNFQLIPQIEVGIGNKIPAAKETATTFVENALLKAKLASRVSGLPAIADDSGLVVPAINSEPGIYSARFAGDNATDSNNIAKLLTKMKNITTTNRKAIFYCVLVFLRNQYDPAPLIAPASWSGEISHEQVGTNGFGYDPIFYVPTKKCTAAQLEATEKNTLSHRAKACNLLAKMIQEFI